MQRKGEKKRGSLGTAVIKKVNLQIFSVGEGKKIRLLGGKPPWGKEKQPSDAGERKKSPGGATEINMKEERSNKCTEEVPVLVR